MPRNPATGHLTPGTLSPMRQVPASIPRPEYVGKKSPAKYTGSHVQSPEAIEKIRAAGKIAAQAIQLVGEHCKPGITTDELDRIGHEFIISQGAYPSTLGYRGYPKSLCSSLNEVICHVIPDNTVLQDTYAQTLHPTYYTKNPNFLKSEQIQNLEFKAHTDFKKIDISERQELIQRICENIWSVNYFNKQN